MTNVTLIYMAYLQKLGARISNVIDSSKVNPKNLKAHLKYVITFAVQYHDALVKVVVLHGGGGVQDGQGALRLGLEGVVGAPVVQVVAQTGDQQPQDLQVGHEALHLARLEHREHSLCDVEGVSPVVVLHRSVILLDA